MVVEASDAETFTLTWEDGAPGDYDIIDYNVYMQFRDGYALKLSNVLSKVAMVYHDASSGPINVVVTARNAAGTSPAS